MSLRWGTPTLEEYLWSHFKAPWSKFEVYSPFTPWQDQETIDYRTEQAIYHNIDLSIAMALWGFHASRVGAYQATNTYHFYRMAQTMQRIGWVISNPVISGSLAFSVASALGWASTADQHGAVTPGVASGFGVPISDQTQFLPEIRRDLRDMFGLN